MAPPPDPTVPPPPYIPEPSTGDQLPPVKKYAFRADPDAIRTCAAEYEILAATKTRLTGYIDEWVELEVVDAPLYSKVRDAVNNVHEKLLSNAIRLEQLMFDSGQELENVAKMYENTDADYAAKFDRENCPDKPSTL